MFLFRGDWEREVLNKLYEGEFLELPLGKAGGPSDVSLKLKEGKVRLI